MKIRRISLKMAVMLPLLCAVWLFAAFWGITAHAAGDIPIDEEHFPEASFRVYVSHISIDKDKNGILSENEIAAVTSIDVSGKGITTLTGIEYFVNLEELNCVVNNIKVLDLSTNVKLKSLTCNRNKLTELNLSKNTLLTSLDCSGNNLATLDVRKNILLTSLDCSGNHLTTLDVSKNTLLTSLNCSRNNLTTLDVSKNTLLTSLDFSGDRYKETNRISNIDLSKNTKLTSLTTGSNGLTLLDISKNTALVTLICYNDNLEILDITKNTVLEEVYCPEIKIKSLDLSQNTALKSLNCYGNSLTSLSTSQNINLEELIFYSNGLNTIDLSKNLKLKNLSCRYNDFSSIDVTQNTNLETFDCSDNNFSYIDVSQNANLETFDCSSNSLTNIDVSHNSSLKYFDCGYNKLSKIDVYNNPNLRKLACDGNMLSELDISLNTMLSSLYCGSNQLSKLDISNNFKLEDLYCSNNRLTSLDVSNHGNIWRLSCANNNLSYIDVSNTRISSKYSLSASDNIYILPTNSSAFDTTTIPGFDKAKVSNVNNADFNQSTGIFSNITGDVTYTYECGRNNDDIFTEIFTITFNNPYIAIDESNFPNSVFRQYVINNIDKNKDGDLSYNERQNVTDLDVSEKGITDLKGIEYFPNLQFLRCNNNELTSLDTSKNGALTTLYCTNNKLASINVSGNSALVRLECQNNNLTTLDISRNTSLTLLNCEYNYLTNKSDIVGFNETISESFYYQRQYYNGYVSYVKNINIKTSKIITNKNTRLGVVVTAEERGKPSKNLIESAKLDGILFTPKSVDNIWNCNNSNLTIINDWVMEVNAAKPGIYTITVKSENSKYGGTDFVKSFKITAIDLKDHTEHEYIVWSSAYDEDGKEIGHYQECFCGEKTATEPHTFDSKLISGIDNNGNTINLKKCTVCGMFQEVEETTVITNKETNIKLTALDETVLDSSLTLNVNEVENVTMPSGKTTLAYDITLTDTNGTEIQPNGSIRVTIPVPAGIDGQRTTVYRKESNGTFTNMKAMYNSTDNTLSFVTNHLSIYAIAENSGITGDVNGDGVVDNTDLALMRFYLSTMPNEYNSAYDINGNGVIDNEDLIQLRGILQAII